MITINKGIKTIKRSIIDHLAFFIIYLSIYICVFVGGRREKRCNESILWLVVLCKIWYLVVSRKVNWTKFVLAWNYVHFFLPFTLGLGSVFLESKKPMITFFFLLC